MLQDIRSNIQGTMAKIIIGLIVISFSIFGIESILLGGGGSGIAEVNGELGEYVTPSPVGIPTPPAIDLIDTQCLYISAPIDEVDAPEIRAGMAARISLDAFSKQFFHGHVRRVALVLPEHRGRVFKLAVRAIQVDGLQHVASVSAG